ncbi:MAG: class I SAM-dependent RNA methyltransferase [Planctomycetota bacterium]
MTPNRKIGHYYANCALGLEEVLEQELRELGCGNMRRQRGAVAFESDAPTAYRACLWLRSAVRVQEEIVRGRVDGREDLYDLTSSVDWSLFMTSNGTLAIDGAVRDSFANDTRFPILVVKDAICDQFRHFDGERPNVERDRPDLPLKLVLRGDEAILYRDLGGEPLHKRGYREVQHKSPLNEALAAGLLLLSEWDREAPLVDPMCGSATLLIEAAFLATDRAPGLGRAFAFERWRDTDQDAWQSAFDEAEERATRGAERCPPIAGNDRHPGSIALAEQALRAARVNGPIELTHSEVRDYKPPFAPAMVVTNPPYGERLQPDEAELTESWQDLGVFLHRKCEGAMAHVLCGSPELTQYLGLRAARRFPVNNGPIECRWLRYAIDSGDASR